MNSPRTLKVSLNNDIRRIGFVASDFQNLKKQISELFSINEESFVMKYKDDEGDMITICSNEEYKESILCCQDKILRIFVVLKNEPEKKKCNKNFRRQRKMRQQQSSQENKSENNNNQVPHETFNPFAFFQQPSNQQQQPNLMNLINPISMICQNLFQGDDNVTINGIVDNLLNSNFLKVEHDNVCDGCDLAISGTRFHCQDCPDFDFCSTCFQEKLQSHDPNHKFQSISASEALRNAIQNNVIIEPIIREGYATDPVEKKVHNAFCDRCDQKIVGLRWKCFDCEDFDFCNACYLVANGKESIKNHLNTHVFGKIDDPLTCYNFQLEKEKHLENKRIQREKIEQERIERERKEQQERLEQEKIEEERIQKEKIEQERLEKERLEKEKKESQPEKIVYPFEQKLQDLHMMGFVDRKRNIQMLIKNKGDIVQTLQDLLPDQI